MAHEIYYTSAPEGARPGQRGFCTVATSPGIPKPLWDRLEAVSGYRHQFSANNGSPQNPVSWAHWLVQAQGREISVLSRVCDSGLDYTQRTNAFAHHIALEANERAAGGPGWMVSRPGLLATSWDGVVGTIARPAHLPVGDAQPATCNRWRNLAGDAGWAGVLAEAAMKHPRRAVCILFSPGMDLLPLIAEAIALLPASRRWDVSFNTYFTGLPGNTVCAWRCCLAGTPAAADAMRHAAGSLVIDLAHPERLGKPPEGPFADAARMGRGVGSLGASSAISSSGSSMNRGRKSTTAPPPIDLAPMEPIEIAPPPMPQFGTAPAVAGGRATRFVRGAAQRSAGTSVLTTAAPDDWSTRDVDTSWVNLHRKTRRRWLLALAVLALAFVAVGFWLNERSRRAASEIGTQPPPKQPEAGPQAIASAQQANGLVSPGTTVTPAVVVTPPDPPTTRQVVTPPTPPPQPPATTKATTDPPPDPEPPQPQPPPVSPPTSDPPPAPAAPTPIVLAAEVEPPAAAGAGIRDPIQTIRIPGAQFDNLRGIASFQIALPPNRSRSYAIRQPGLSGVLKFEPSPRGGLRESINWRDAVSPNIAAEVAMIAFEQPRPGQPPDARIEVTWRAGTLLKRPEVAVMARILLQNAELIVADARGQRPQTITFKPVTPTPVPLSPVWSPLALPQMPAGVILREEKELPDGWKVTWVPGPAAGGEAKPAGVAALEAARNPGDGSADVGILKFERASELPALACRFELRIAGGWKRVTSTWNEQHQSARTSAGRTSAEFSRIEQEINRAQNAEQNTIDGLEKELKEAQAQLTLSDEELKNRFTNRANVRMRIERAKAALGAVKTKVETAAQEAAARLEKAAANRQLAAAANEAYERLQDAEIVVELPDKLRVAVLRLTIAAKP